MLEQAQQEVQEEMMDYIAEQLQDYMLVVEHEDHVT